MKAVVKVTATDFCYFGEDSSGDAIKKIADTIPGWRAIEIIHIEENEFAKIPEENMLWKLYENQLKYQC